MFLLLKFVTSETKNLFLPEAIRFWLTHRQREYRYCSTSGCSHGEQENYFKQS